MNSIHRPFLILRIQIPHLLADDERQFDFVVQTDAFGEQDGTPAARQDGRGRFEEEEGLFGPGVG